LVLQGVHADRNHTGVGAVQEVGGLQLGQFAEVFGVEILVFAVSDLDSFDSSGGYFGRSRRRKNLP